MQLNLERLKGIWEQIDAFQNRWKHSPGEEILRFNRISENIEHLLKVNIEITSKTSLKIKFDNQDTVIENCHTGWFGPAKDSIAANSIEESWNNTINRITNVLPEDKKEKVITLLKEVWYVLGLDDDRRRRPEFRIMSQNVTTPSDYNGSLTPVQSNPDAHFASNNYFFNIIRFLKKVKEDNSIKFDQLIGTDSETQDQVPIVLRYPYFNDPNLKDTTQESKEADEHMKILKKRFPLKFLWMWANKDRIIVPLSLLVMRNFCESELYKKIIENNDLKGLIDPHNSIIDSDYDNFCNIWQKVSDALYNELNIQTADERIELSRLLSHLLLLQEDFLLLQELLKKGCQAVILYGPPGTSKTYEAKMVAQELAAKGNIEMVQFHPTYAYEDFIEGIKPDVVEKKVIYKMHDGVFKNFCNRAEKDPDNNYIFIVDEINRANLSDVLGEVLYCIENRGEEGKVTLPYSKTPFYIPKNLYLIGTMNNVDKSLVTFDFALRRRFAFFYCKPEADKLWEGGLLGDVIHGDSLGKFIQACHRLNDFIIKNLRLNKEHQIGHAYFARVKDFLPQLSALQTITIVELEMLWTYHLLPLLEEYLGTRVEASEMQDKLKEAEQVFFNAFLSDRCGEGA